MMCFRQVPRGRLGGGDRQALAREESRTFANARDFRLLEPPLVATVRTHDERACSPLGEDRQRKIHYGPDPPGGISPAVLMGVPSTGFVSRALSR